MSPQAKWKTGWPWINTIAAVGSEASDLSYSSYLFSSSGMISSLSHSEWLLTDDCSSISYLAVFAV